MVSMPHQFDQSSASRPGPAPDRAREGTAAELTRPPLYFLFAHEAYYPDHSAREVNTTLVSAQTLLHRQIRQPDGTRMHRVLTRDRPPGEIVPLSTLTHELGGGSKWSQIADWEAVIRDVVQLARCGHCDAVHFALPSLDRALLCSGPHSEVRTSDPVTHDTRAYGPEHRAAVLHYIRQELDAFTAGQAALWPGTPLLSPLPTSSSS